MESKSNINLEGKKVLVVDDSMMNRMLASMILKDCGILVSEAADGEQAVNFLKNSTCNLILMDLQMPLLNGFQATEIIRKELQLNTPIIALTGNFIATEREKCLEIGMNYYQSKPYERDVFIDMIKKYIL